MENFHRSITKFTNKKYICSYEYKSKDKIFQCLEKSYFQIEELVTIAEYLRTSNIEFIVDKDENILLYI
jgi:hypothetical protein